MAGFDVQKNRPLLTKFMERVRQDLQPYYDEAHKIVYIVKEKSKL